MGERPDSDQDKDAARPGERASVEDENVDQEGDVGPAGDADEGTQSDAGLASGGGTQAEQGERVGAEDESEPPQEH